MIACTALATHTHTAPQHLQHAQSTVPAESDAVPHLDVSNTICAPHYHWNDTCFTQLPQSVCYLRPTKTQLQGSVSRAHVNSTVTCHTSKTTTLRTPNGKAELTKHCTCAAKSSFTLGQVGLDAISHESDTSCFHPRPPSLPPMEGSYRSHANNCGHESKPRANTALPCYPWTLRVEREPFECCIYSIHQQKVLQ